MPWLTYQQIGERFGMNAEAARGRVRRLGWRTQPGNDGRTLALVPDDIELHPGGVRTHPDGVQADDRADAERLADLLAATEVRAERADERADEAGRRADAALAVADRTLAQLADAAERADRAEARADRAETAIAGERQRADALRATIDELKAGQAMMVDVHARELAIAQQAAQEAQETADELRQADGARKARGRLRRAWDGWRGRR